jgi:hypothetical protein
MALEAEIKVASNARVDSPFVNNVKIAEASAIAIELVVQNHS